MEELRVPKRRARVQLILDGGSSRTVDVFLTDFAATHTGPERLSDVLNGQAQFIPVVDSGSNAVFFLNRTSVAVARVAADVEGEDAGHHTIPTEHEVEITVVGGTKLKGLVTYVMPSDRSRLTDYLNEPTRFIKLIESDGVALINKAHVTFIETFNNK
jgi:hypothetical protein